MHTAATVLVLALALLHLNFLVLEMFVWDTPRGHRLFDQTPEQAALTAPLAKNQGLYNGFLAAGLVWGAIAASSAGSAIEGHHLELFFCGCVVVAGIYGAITAVRRILLLQALPGAIALAAVLLAGT